MRYMISTDRNLRLANTDEIEKHNKLISDKMNVQNLYRGDKILNLLNAFNVKILAPHNEKIEYELAFKVFNIGAKSNYYVGNKTSKNIDIIHENVENVSVKTFEKIFYNLKILFLNDSTNRDFLKKIENYSILNLLLALSPSEKVIVRDYYLSILHQTKGHKYHSYSALISTSSEEDIARRFGSSENSEYCLFNYFVPKKLLSKLCVGYEMTVDKVVLSLLHNNKLPIISSMPHPDEKEYSIKRALFPHFIASLELVSGIDKTIILNPYFSNKRYNHEIAVSIGLEVNQSHFLEIIRDTNFFRTGLFDGELFIENT